MPLDLPEPGSSAPAINPGTYAGRCFTIADLGTQTDEYLGVKKTAPKAILLFELSDEKTEDGKVRWLSKEIALYTNDKSNLAKILESWTGAPMTEERWKKFKLKSLLGFPAILTVGHSKTGKAKITAITKIMANQEVTQLISPRVFFEMDVNGKDLLNSFSQLPAFIQEKVKLSPEYKKSLAPVTAKTPEPVAAGAPDPNDPPF